jgi:uncharacterized delta-60 repeat protein
VATDFFGGRDEAVGLVIQPDGRILACGVAARDGQNDFAVARYNADGNLDPTFGVGGKVVTDFFGTGDAAWALALQPDDRVLLVGVVFRSGGNADFGIARYNPDGSLDMSFDTDGKVTTDFFGINDGARAIVLQPDGRIVVAGEAFEGPVTTSSDWVVARYSGDGSLDTSFGEGGKVTADFSDKLAQVSDMALQSDGHIVIAGGSQGTLASSEADFLVARYDSDGRLDTGFAAGGKLTLDVLGAFDTARGLDIQADGRLVVAALQALEAHARNSRLRVSLA